MAAINQRFSMLSDSQLLHAYSVQGSQEAFGELVQRHLPLVYRSALRQLSFDTHRAEDVSQMVFVGLARQAPQLLQHTNLSAWLYSTTHRTACQVLRAEMRRRKRETAWASQADVSTSASEPLWTEVAPALDEAIRALGAKDREAVLLRFFGDRSFAEIGDMLQLGEDAARMRVSRALDKLRELLDNRGVVVTPTALAGLIASDAALGAPVGLASSISATAAQVAPAAVTVGSIWISFMVGSKFITTAVALLAAVAVGVSLQQRQENQIAALELQSAQDEIVALQQRIAAAERRVAAVRARPQPAAVSEAIVTSDDAFAAAREEGDKFLAANPEVREALTRSQYAKVRGKYLPLYRALNLTDAQIAEFEKLLAGAGGRSWPNAGLLMVGEPMLPAARDLRLKALLGEAGFAHFEKVRLRDSGDALAQALATRLAYREEPLTPEKSAAVRDIIDAARQGNAFTDEVWVDALPLLETVLTPKQIEEMKAVCAQERYQRARLASTRK